MAWLHQGSARGAFVRARRDLFSDLSLVSMDTTSLSLHGQRHGLAIEWADLLRDLDSRRQPSRRTASVTPRTAVPAKSAESSRPLASRCRLICTNAPPDHSVGTRV